MGIHPTPSRRIHVFLCPNISEATMFPLFLSLVQVIVLRNKNKNVCYLILSCLLQSHARSRIFFNFINIPKKIIIVFALYGVVLIGVKFLKIVLRVGEPSSDFCKNTNKFLKNMYAYLSFQKFISSCKNRNILDI